MFTNETNAKAATEAPKQDETRKGPPKLNLIVNGNAKYGYGVYTYVSFWDTRKCRSAPKDRHRVGKIENKQRNGRIIFNPEFLEANPVYKDYVAYREGSITRFVPKELDAVSRSPSDYLEHIQAQKAAEQAAKAGKLADNEAKSVTA